MWSVPRAAAWLALVSILNGNPAALAQEHCMGSPLICINCISPAYYHGTGAPHVPLLLHRHRVQLSLMRGRLTAESGSEGWELTVPEGTTGTQLS